MTNVPYFLADFLIVICDIQSLKAEKETRTQRSHLLILSPSRQRTKKKHAFLLRSVLTQPVKLNLIWNKDLFLISSDVHYWYKGTSSIEMLRTRAFPPPLP